jgi:membrane-bound lytic murein transglycosylase D
MRKLLPIFLLVFTHFAIAFPDVRSIPQVPSSITIANVKLKITPDAQAQIQKDVDALRASEKYFKIKLDRINLYFPIIEKALAEAGIPDDIKYLSVQESSLISDAVSSADAVGYWQFKDFTAREVGMRVDGKIDERKNIGAASRGAATYFKRNNYFLKNWIYAVSAYQAGPTGVKRYVDQKFVDTGKLTVDKDTHWYAKRFIAHVIAFRDEVGQPHSEGIHLQEYTQGEGKTLGNIAKEFGVDEDELEKYNKWLKSGKIPSDKEYIVIIPLTGKAPKIAETKKEEEIKETPALTRDIKQATKPKENIYPDEIVADLGKSKIIFSYNGIKAIIARKGDTKESLAKRGGIDKKRFDKYNEMLAGQPLSTNMFYFLRKKKNKSSTSFHVAKKGETLWEISQRYGVKAKKISQYNREPRSTSFKAGRVIYLKGKRPPGEPQFTKVIEESFKPVQKSPRKTEALTTVPVATADDNVPKVTEEPQPTEKEERKNTPKETEYVEDKTTYDIHIVQLGESLISVANKYNVAKSQLLEWNGMFEGEVISEGQNLQIGAPVEVFITKKEEPDLTNDAKIEKIKTPKKSADSGVHIVATGDTFYSISRSYNMEITTLLSLNDLTESSALSVGQQLFIYTNEEASNTTKEVESVPTVTEIAVDSEEATHTVAAGETFYGIARKYNLSVTTLLALNDLKNNSSLSVGQSLFISPESAMKKLTDQAPENIPEEKEEGRKEEAVNPLPTVHTVKAGDTFYGIAQQYGLTINEVLELNQMGKASTLSIGQKLNVNKNGSNKESPTKKEAPENKTKSTGASANGKHVVGSGETLYGIATNYKISVKQLLEWNNFEPNRQIKPGESINIAGSEQEEKMVPDVVEEKLIKEKKEPIKKDQHQIHIVRGGDTLYGVASKYGMSIHELKKLNDKKENSLSVGEELKVNKQ